MKISLSNKIPPSQHHHTHSHNYTADTTLTNNIFQTSNKGSDCKTLAHTNDLMMPLMENICAGKDAWPMVSSEWGNGSLSPVQSRARSRTQLRPLLTALTSMRGTFKFHHFAWPSYIVTHWMQLTFYSWWVQQKILSCGSDKTAKTDSHWIIRWRQKSWALMCRDVSLLKTMESNDGRAVWMHLSGPVCGERES